MDSLSVVLIFTASADHHLSLGSVLPTPRSPTETGFSTGCSYHPAPSNPTLTWTSLMSWRRRLQSLTGLHMQLILNPAPIPPQKSFLNDLQLLLLLFPLFLTPFPSLSPSPSSPSHILSLPPLLTLLLPYPYLWKRNCGCRFFPLPKIAPQTVSVIFLYS